MKYTIPSPRIEGKTTRNPSLGRVKIQRSGRNASENLIRRMNRISRVYIAFTIDSTILASRRDSFSAGTNCGCRHKIFSNIPARSPEFHAKVRDYCGACIRVENYGNGSQEISFEGEEKR